MSFGYVSLFSGAGGLDIGLERAGLVPFSLCEIEKNFCSTLENNQGWCHSDQRSYLGNARILNADIRELSPQELYPGGELDLVVGGPPCQAFSSSGKQLSVLDPRGALISEFFRIIDAMKPRMFLLENVRGLVTARDKSGEPGGVIKELIHSLEEIGYSCRAALLNAADFGAFQRRVRCFILGSSRGTVPVFPEPTFSKDSELFGNPWRTLEGFLGTHADEDEGNFTYPSERLAGQLKAIRPGSGLKSPGRAEPTRPGGHWGYRQGTFIADLSLPARTVTGSSSQDWIRWKGVLRRLTFPEIKLLQGFPDDWRVEGTKAQRYKQIGNAVPTVFGEAIGNVIVQHLNAFPATKPVRVQLPKKLEWHMDYTKRDHARNASARIAHQHFDSLK